MKRWMKPTFKTLTVDELSEYICVAARSRQCPMGFFR